MDYRKLGRTGLMVSSLCLGTMQWGWTADETAAFGIMDAFVDISIFRIAKGKLLERWE